MKKIINGVKVIENNGRIICDFGDYKAAREAKHMRWSEKSFCDWCDKYGIEAQG